MIKSEFVTHKREPFFQLALDYINSESKVLDIGPGSGKFSKFCKRNDFYLLEGNPETINLLKTGNKHVYHGVLPDIPFKDEFFDVIHCSHVIEHLSSQQLYDTLVSMNKVLKVGGYLVVSTPLYWSGFYDDLSHVRPYNPFVLEKYLTGKFPDSLSREVISAEFSVERLEYRYGNMSKEIIHHTNSRNIVLNLVVKIMNRIYRVGVKRLQKTGYTIVLKKNG